MSLTTPEYRIGTQWTIKKSEVHNSENLKSPTYVIPYLPGIKYYLTLYPYVGGSSNSDVSIMLNFESKEKITVSCTISVASASLKCEMINQVFDKNLKSYHLILTTRSKLFDPYYNFFGTDQMLKIKLDGSLRLQLPQPEKKQPANAPGPLSLSQALWQKEDKDVTIIAEKKEIMVHKWILCGNSPVFKAEMRSGMKKVMENRIYIDDFTFEAVKTVIEYLYERNIRSKINEENAYELLHFAYKYDVRGFKHVLQDVLMQKITVSNVCMFANMSITSSAHELRECCICFLLKCAGKSVIADIEALDDEILREVGRRSLL